MEILGYTLKPAPDYNIVLEKKNVDDSRKADGAIIRNEDIIAVIELKSTKTSDLDKIENQAFGYKNHHPGCIYIITSNFEKIRLYIQNAVDYIEFDLFNLIEPKFKLLWLCLSKNSIQQDLPLKIKEASVLQEKHITKKLYDDYSEFRLAIFDNIVKSNPDYVQSLTILLSFYITTLLYIIAIHFTPNLYKNTNYLPPFFIQFVFVVIINLRVYCLFIKYYLS